MKIFSSSKNPIRKLETALADARSQRAKLADRLVVAEQEAETRQREAVAAAVADDVTALDRAEVAKRSAEDRIATLGAALQEIDAAVQKAEAELATAIDKETRTATANQLNELAGQFQDELPSIIASFAKMAELSEKSSPVVPEAVALGNFSRNAATESMAACEMVIKALRNQAERVYFGDGPATIAEPAPPLPSIPPPPTQRVILKYDSKWSIGKDIQQVRPMGWGVDLPVEMAERAIAAKIAFREGDPAAREVIQAAGSTPHVQDASRVVDLDADEPRPPPPIQREITYRELRRPEQVQGWHWPAPASDQF